MLYMARHNKGVFEPEVRLWLLTVALIIMPFTIILWGVGAAHHIHWIGLVFAQAIITAVNVTFIPITINYVIDCYRDMSGQAMTVVIIIRNTMYFATSYG